MTSCQVILLTSSEIKFHDGWGSFQRRHADCNIAWTPQCSHQPHNTLNCPSNPASVQMRSHKWIVSFVFFNRKALCSVLQGPKKLQMCETRVHICSAWCANNYKAQLPLTCGHSAWLLTCFINSFAIRIRAPLRRAQNGVVQPGKRSTYWKLMCHLESLEKLWPSTGRFVINHVPIDVNVLLHLEHKKL